MQSTPYATVEEAQAATARPWYADTAMWGALLLALFTIAQFVVAVGAAVQGAENVWAALASLGWGQWAASIGGALAGVGVALMRIRAGRRTDTLDPQIKIRRPGGGVRAAAPVVALVAGAALLASSCSPAWQAGGAGVAVVGQACEPAHDRCVSAVEDDVSDPWEAEAAIIACDTGLRYCDLGRRWAAAELARRAAEAAAREAAEGAGE